MGKHMRSWTILAVVSLLAIAFSVSPAAALTKTPLGVNLVKNAGFEATVGGNGYTINYPTKWDSSQGNWTVVKYGSTGFPTVAESNRIGGGKNFASCGPSTASSILFQEITILGRNSAIDAELLYIRVRVRLATYDSQDDNAQLHVNVYNGNDQQLTSFNTPAKTHTNGQFVLAKFSHVLPAGARSLIVVLEAHRVGGATDYCDAYFDNVSVVLNHL